MATLRLAVLADLLRKHGVRAEAYPGCDPASVWVSPAAAHGIWLQFVEGRPD